MKTIREIIEENIEDLNGKKIKDMNFMVVDMQAITREICKEIEDKVLSPIILIRWCEYSDIESLLTLWREFKQANGLEK